MATLSFLYADHLAQGRDSYEPQRVNNFIFECTPPGADAADSEVLKLSVNTGPMVQEANEEVEVHHLNERVYIAGKATFETGELVLKDFVNKPTAAIVQAWRKKVYDATTGKIGLARDYKVDANILLYAPNGTYERKWTLKGCWPTTVNYSQGLDYSTGDVNTITVTMRYDKALAANLRVTG